MHKALKLARAGLFKSAAFVLALAAIAVMWMWNASILVTGEDLNLRLLKWTAAWLPSDYGSKTEAALRLFGADKVFIFTEVVVAVKLVLLGVGRFIHPFRKHNEEEK